ncbi:MAG: YjbF family lipoprotein [Mangrovicoccus sp.]
MAKLRRAAGLFGAALFGLAGCSSNVFEPGGSDLFTGAIQAVIQVFGERPDVTQLTTGQFAQFDVPVILVTLEDGVTFATAIPLGQNKNMVTWITGDGKSVMLKDGVLFGTRGLINDLMTAETDLVDRQLSSRQAGEYTRAFRFLAGDESITVDRFYCELTNDGQVSRRILDVTRSTTQWRELCFGINTDTEFENFYWLGGDGTIWDSRQWAGPYQGGIQIQTIQK